MEIKGSASRVNRNLGDGADSAIQLLRGGELAVSDTHARLQEAAIRGGLFGGGMTLTAITNATFSTATLGATATPIVGLYNPSSSGKNAVIIQAKLQVIITALQVTGPGAFMWCVSAGNTAVSTGNTPYSKLTLLAAGSVMKDMSGVALTGLTNNLRVVEASTLNGGPISNLSTLQTAAGLMPAALPSVENIDGSIIIPPGGVLALLCTTNAPVAISAAAGLLWEEVLV